MRFAAIVLLLLPYKTSEFKGLFIIWNVGQGLWQTAIQPHRCDHFDAGGERSVIAQVIQLCKDKTHHIHLSHWDWDHISFVRELCLSSRCEIKARPRGPTNLRKWHFLIRQKMKEQKKWNWNYKPKKANDWSRVYGINNHFLLTADATKSSEKIWAKKVSRYKTVIVGHHGSNTSSWDFLLKSLPNLQMAIVSARKKRYGHPHKRVIQRFKEIKNLNLISTEDFGTIAFELQRYSLEEVF